MTSPAKQRSDQTLTWVEEANAAYAKGVMEGSRDKLDFLIGAQGWIRHTLEFLKDHKIKKGEEGNLEGEGTYWAYDEGEDQLVRVVIKDFFKGGAYQMFHCGYDIYNKYLKLYKWLHIKSAQDPKVVEFREAYYKGELPTREACESKIGGGKKQKEGDGEKISMKEILAEKEEEIKVLKGHIKALEEENRNLRKRNRALRAETPKKKQKTT